jgi:hypothetical protein
MASRLLMFLILHARRKNFHTRFKLKYFWQRDIFKEKVPRRSNFSAWQESRTRRNLFIRVK